MLRYVRLTVILVLCFLVLGSVYYYPKRENLGAIFDRVYTEGSWGRDTEGHGISGSGSSLEITKQYRSYLEAFIREQQITSIVDAGSGDWSFSRSIDWGSARYLGIDVSPLVLNAVKQQYENQQFKFQVGDVTQELPPADLLICKDVLQHLSNKKVLEFIRNNLRIGKYRWAIITNDRELSGANIDIESGDWHSLDLSKPPFNVQGLVDLPIVFGNEHRKVTQLLRLERP